MSSHTRPVDAVTDTTAAIRAVLEIQPNEDFPCPVVERVPDAAAVTQSLSACDARRSCQTEVTIVENDQTQRRYVATDLSDRACICRTIGQFECVFRIDAIESGTMVVSIVLEDRGLLSEVVSALRNVAATVRLRRIVRLDGNADSRRDETIEVDATAITDKQREAVEVALDMGYYDRPRNATLSDLADRLGVTKSAVSQRLNAAEATVVRSFASE